MFKRGNEKKHIKKQGERFTLALCHATMVVRASPHFVGLDKVRAPIAWQAALKATGYNTAPFVLPPDAGDPMSETDEIAAQLFEDAVYAARKAIAKTTENAR